MNNGRREALGVWLLITLVVTAPTFGQVGACAPRVTRTIEIPQGTKTVDVKWSVEPYMNEIGNSWNCDCKEVTYTYGPRTWGFDIATSEGVTLFSQEGTIPVVPALLPGPACARSPEVPNDPPPVMHETKVNVATIAANQAVTAELTQRGCWIDGYDQDPLDIEISVAVPVRTPPTVRIHPVTPGRKAAMEEIDPGDYAASAQVALGTVFELRIVRKGGFLEPVEPLPSIYATEDASVSPEPRAPSLFKDDVLLRFGDEDAAPNKMTYQAVHLGTTTVSMLPTTTDEPPMIVTINVIRPTRLGKANAVDEAIVTAAHDRGIPPQYFKAQSRKETGPKFKVDTYRYEPCGADLAYLSAGKTKIDTDPYSLYKMDDAIGVTLMPGIPDDLDPRNAYSIFVIDPATGTKKKEKLTDAHRDITAQQIFDANDSWVNWTVFCSKKVKEQLAGETGSAIFDFVAQTPTGASYGLFQMMYDTALDLDWEGVALDASGERSKAPKYLFDRPEYVEMGGGSILLGTKLDVKSYRKVMNSKSPCKGQSVPAYPEQLKSHAQFEKFLRKAFDGYNCAYKEPATGHSYGEGVLEFSLDYPPIQTEPIFW
jgi:hypothetical protein